MAQGTADPLSGIATADSVDRTVRRNAMVLTIATAFGGSMMPIAVALAGLVGSYLLASDKSLATVPVTALTVGSALATLPAATLMAKIGRRYGFVAGSVPAMIGGIVACFAILQNSFVLFTFGCLLVGCSAAFVQQYRFAAVDGGSEVVRGKALGLVMGGGVLAAIVGPQAAIFTRDLFAPIPFAGAFLAIAVLSLGNALVTSRLSDLPPPIRPIDDIPMPARSLREIARQPRFVAAVLCAMSSYALMSLVMTAAPLAMVGCGLTQDDAALGIQWHVLAMFAPSFFTGHLIARFGVHGVIMAGALLILACVGINLSGTEYPHYIASLVLLGVGWNFMFIGATTLLTTTHDAAEKAKVQGLNEFVIFTAVALASLASGAVQHELGWEFVNLVVAPLVLGALAAVLWLRLRTKP
jgi:MFS family permease